MASRTKSKPGRSFLDKIKEFGGIKAEAPSPRFPEETFRAWREKLLTLVLWSGTIIIGTNLLYSGVIYYRNDRWDLIALFLAVLLFYLCLASCKRIPFPVRGLGALSIPLLMGVVVLCQFWLNGSGRILLLAFSAMAGIMMGIRVALATVPINLAILVVIGLLGDAGYLTFPLSSGGRIEDWPLFAFTFFTLNSIFAFTLSMAVHRLRRSLREQESLALALEEDRARLRRAMEMKIRESEERAKAEAALDAERARSDAILDRLPAYVALIAPDYTLPYANRFFRNFFGDIEGRSCFHIFKGRNAPCAACPRPQIIKGEPGCSRNEMITYSGRTFNVYRHPLRTRDGVTTVLEMGFDITPLLRAREAARKSREKYYDLVKNISDIIFTHDLEGRLLSVNPAAEKLLGYRTGEILYKNIAEFIVPQGPQALKSQYLDRIVMKGALNGIAECVTRSGDKRHVEYRNVLVREKDRQPYVSGSARDVTERVLAERELRWMEEQLVQAQKMEAVGTLSSGIAHDFNNILQAISGNAQILLGAPGRPDRELGNLREIDRAVERATELVRRLLTFSRKVKPDLKPIDLHQEVIQSVKLLERTIPKMVVINTELAAPETTINADPNQIEQVIMNLGLNARDAMEKGGLLTISTENVTIRENEDHGPPGLSPGSYILLKVSDTGLGIPPDKMEHIFEPFFSTKEPGRGTGLGLSTVYGIVSNHGGRILCQSEEGRGTIFFLYLPVLAGVEPLLKPDIMTRQELPGGTETILVVDDEPAVLDLAENILSLKGYQIITARSGEEALEVHHHRGNELGLIILDLGMPGMGGLNCLKRLSVLEPRVPVIISSGYTNGENASGMIRAGAKAFLGKPYRLTDLLALVRHVLDEHQGRGTAPPAVEAAHPGLAGEGSPGGV